MANIVQTKRSSVAGKVPTAASLAVGELAVNFADQKLYTKDAGGSVIEVAPPMLPDFDPTAAYAAGDLIFRGGQILAANSALTAAAFDATNWDTVGAGGGGGGGGPAGTIEGQVQRWDNTANAWVATDNLTVLADGTVQGTWKLNGTANKGSKHEVVTALPGVPDANTIYYVLT